MSVSNLQVLDSVANANGDIMAAPLANMIELRMNLNTKSYIKLGLDNEMAQKMALNQGQYVGMLYVCSIEDYKKHEKLLSTKK